MLGPRIFETYLAARDRPGNQIGATLDAIRQHAKLAAAQTRHAVDDDLVGAGAADLGADRIEEIGQIDDLGLACRVLEHGLPLGEGRRHHQIFGARDGHGVEHEPRSAQALGAGADVAVFDRYLGAHRLQTGDVDVHRARADRAAAGQRNVRLPEAREQRPEHQNRGPHGFDEIVGRDRLLERTRLDFDVHALIDRDRHSHATEQLDHGGDVLQMRHVADRHRFRGQQSAGQNRQRGIFGAGDANLPLEDRTTVDLQSIHQRAPASSGVRASMESAWISRPTSSPKVR